MTVVNEKTLGVRNVDSVDGRIRNLRVIVIRTLGDSVGQLRTGVDTAVENVYKRVTGFTARDTGPQDGGDVRVFDPRVNNKRANRVDDNDSIRVDLRDSVNKVLAVLESSEVVSIALCESTAERRGRNTIPVTIRTEEFTGGRLNEDNCNILGACCYLGPSVVVIVEVPGERGVVLAGAGLECFVGLLDHGLDNVRYETMTAHTEMR